jgi:hypothetical protein
MIRMTVTPCRSVGFFTALVPPEYMRLPVHAHEQSGLTGRLFEDIHSVVWLSIAVEVASEVERIHTLLGANAALHVIPFEAVVDFERLPDLWVRKLAGLVLRFALNPELVADHVVQILIDFPIRRAVFAANLPFLNRLQSGTSKKIRTIQDAGSDYLSCPIDHGPHSNNAFLALHQRLSRILDTDWSDFT